MYFQMALVSVIFLTNAVLSPAQVLGAILGGVQIKSYFTARTLQCVCLGELQLMCDHQGWVWKEAKSLTRTKFRPLSYVGKESSATSVLVTWVGFQREGEEGECVSPEADLTAGLEFMVLSSSAVISCPFSPDSADSLSHPLASGLWPGVSFPSDFRGVVGSRYWNFYFYLFLKVHPFWPSISVYFDNAT